MCTHPLSIPNGAGACPSTPWTGNQTETIHTYRHFRVSKSLTLYVSGLWEETQTQGEHANTQERPNQQVLDSNSQYICCEMTVLTTAPMHTNLPEVNKTNDFMAPSADSSIV